MSDLGVAISFPFRFGVEQGVKGSAGSATLYGGATMATNDYRTIWKDRVYVALLTGLGERVMDPTYGTQVTASVFETEDRAALMSKESISSAFGKWLPDLTLRAVAADYDYANGALVIKVDYTLPDETEDTLVFKTTTFDQYGTVIREGA